MNNLGNNSKMMLQNNYNRNRIDAQGNEISQHKVKGWRKAGSRSVLGSSHGWPRRRQATGYLFAARIIAASNPLEEPSGETLWGNPLEKPSGESSGEPSGGTL